MTTLPAADWTRRPAYQVLVAALGAETMRWVGGCVRDTLYGCDSHDIDAATPLTPAEVIDRCRDAGIRTVPTGIDHGTVTAILDGGNVEITTLRKDVATDGRRATIAFASEWADDAARRDFTINALYAHPETLAVSDYFGGIDDLAARRVRFIGDPRARIREDYLRLLRFFRFTARFGDGWDDDACRACEELAPGLKGLSRERVGWELINLLSLPDPSAAITKMRALGVIQQILPESTIHGDECLVRLIATEETHAVARDPIRRLAAMLPAVRPVAETVSARLRLSKSQRDRLCCIAMRDARDKEDPRALAYAVGPVCAVDRLLIAGHDPAQVADWEVPRLPLKGGAIVARGVGKGPEVARILQAVERRWVAEGFPDEERVQALLDEELAAR